MQRAMLILSSLMILVTAFAQAEETLKLETPLVLRNVRIVAEPGRVIERGSIVIRDRQIVAVGATVDVPAGALEIDAKGHTAYAGFIDGFTRAGVVATKETAETERRWHGEFPSVTEGPRVETLEANRAGIYARRRVESQMNGATKTFADHRRAGFAVAHVAPPRAILGGSSALVMLGDGPLREGILRTQVAQTAAFAPPGARKDPELARYPATLLGVMAHFRQVMLDADYYTRMQAHARDTASPLLPYDPDLVALQELRTGGQRLFWEADREDEILRALGLGREFELSLGIVGGANAYDALDPLATAEVPLILSSAFPKKPRSYELKRDEVRRGTDNDTLFGKNWERRPFAPPAQYALATSETDRQVANLHKVEEAGLVWCLGTIDQKPRDALVGVRRAIEQGLSADAALGALTTTPARLFGVEQQLGTLAPGKRAAVTVLRGALGDKQATVRWLVIDDRLYAFNQSDDKKSAKDKGGTESKNEDDKSGQRVTANADAEAAVESGPREQAPRDAALDAIMFHEPDWPIETEADRKPAFRTDGSLLLQNATVLTVSGDDLSRTDILIRNGKIAEIGSRLAAPAGVPTLDLDGYVVMPGIFDPHTHFGLNGVNEGSLSVTPEVRISDVINHESRRFFDALAGGVTTVHAMHGSANTIGGQNCILKMKYGEPSAALIAPRTQRTVKFALGENVVGPGKGRRRNANRPRRFPATRMGVEATVRRALHAGQRYNERRQAQSAATQPLRRDLRLEALADIHAGNIWVHCHAYRADEMTRLLTVCEEFGLRIAAFHHVLEGYRIMPELRNYGIGTATFSDWWAYKIEAYDAVPHNAGMLLRAGINSAIKSDSSDLVRHLPLEAAKCMKYSGLTTNETLRLITLNPARMFAMEDRVGSIDLGKDADLAIYNGHPLDTFSKCVMTLVGGEVFFQHPDFDAQQPSTPMGQKIFPSDVDLSTASALVRRGVWTAPSPLVDPARYDPQATYAITNATIHPISGPVIENGTIVWRNGRIVSVEAGAAPADATVFDVAGRHVYPGLINAGTQLGLAEIDSIDMTLDTREIGMFQPDLRAVTAFNPHSRMIEITRAEGILTAMVLPNGPTIAGRAGIVHLDGWTLGEMEHLRDAAMLINPPTRRAAPIVPPAEKSKDDGAKWREQYGKLARFVERARLYDDAVRAGASPPFDTRLEALRPYARGTRPVLIRANRYKEILEALALARRLELRVVLLGGREAWKVADLLVAQDVPVIYEGVFSVPRRNEPWDVNYRAPSVMAAAGVKFCFAHNAADLAKQLPIEAGFAVAHGLDPDAAVRALTLTSAEILGVAEDLGSLEPGKLANLIVTTDHPCQATNRVLHALVRGKPISLESAHTRAARHFAQRPLPEQPDAPITLRGAPSQTMPAGK